MEHKIKKVKTLSNYNLVVAFSDETLKVYDIKPLFKKIPEFLTLKDDKQMFKSVKVDVGGYGLFWNDKLDLSSDEIWEKGLILY